MGAKRPVFVLRLIPLIILVINTDCQILSNKFAWSQNLGLPCTKFPSSCWLSSDIWSVEDCEQICNEFDNICLSYTYNWSSGLCTVSNMSVFTFPSGILDLEPAQGVTFFQQNVGGFIDVFERWPHSTLPVPQLYKTLLYNTSVEACAEECTKNTYFRCQSFGYSSLLSNCYLSDTRVDQIGGVLKYLDILDHYQYRRNVWLCNITIPFNHHNKVFATPKYPYQSLFNSVCRTTIWIPPGYALLLNFTWINFEKDTCNTAGDGISIFTGNNLSDTHIIDRLCRQDMAGNYIVTNANFLQVLTNTRSSSIEYEASFSYERVQNNSVNITDSTISRNSSCMKNPCLNGGICFERYDTLTCICLEGYTGEICEDVIGPCTGVFCMNGQCFEGNETFTCLCDFGYTGQYCEVDVNECETNACPKSMCVNMPGTYKCECPQCQFGLCVYNGDVQSCQCFPGFNGNNCTEEINECEKDNPCHHGNCTDFVNGIECSCEDGYTGRYCNVPILHPCDNHPCECGTCVIEDDDFRCECPATRTGKHCEKIEELNHNILETNSLTNQFCNISLCEEKIHTICHFAFLTYFKNIEESYSDVSIISVKLSHTKQAKISKACSSNVSSGNMTVCKVAVVFLDAVSITDLLLLDLHCDIKDCYNSSLSIASLVFMSNIQIENLFTCLPVSLIEIHHQEISSNILISDGNNIPMHLVEVLYYFMRTDINGYLQTIATKLIIQLQFLSCKNSSDVCDKSHNTVICENRNNFPTSTMSPTPKLCTQGNCINGFCSDLDTSPYCVCNAGFTGKLCEISICSNYSCEHCTINETTETQICPCENGRNGDICNTSMVNSCDDAFCINGRCSMNSNGSTYCTCHDGFTGQRCQIKESKCSNFFCVNGNCSLDNRGLPRCDCYFGFTGQLCENEIRICSDSVCIHGNCLQNGSCECDTGYEGEYCDQRVADPAKSPMFDYVLWIMVSVMTLLLIVTLATVVCVKVRRNRTKGEFTFHHLHGKERNTRSPRLIDSRHIHEDLRRRYYLSPTNEQPSDTEASLRPSSHSLTTFHPHVELSRSACESDISRTSEGYRRYSIPDNESFSQPEPSDSQSSSQLYDIPPPPRYQQNSPATSMHTFLQYAVPVHNNASPVSSNSDHFGDRMHHIAGADVDNSEA